MPNHPPRKKRLTQVKNPKTHKGPVYWADFFPEMEVYKTEDPRIFQTKWDKVAISLDGTEGTKKKTYFACIIGGNCYGVDVLRPLAVDARLQCEEAFEKVLDAVKYFEQNKLWPHDDITLETK